MSATVSLAVLLPPEATPVMSSAISITSVKSGAFSLDDLGTGVTALNPSESNHALTLVPKARAKLKKLKGLTF